MVNPLEEFVEYCENHIKGDEKGEAQIFLDRFFTALGHKDGLKGAGANCEFRIRNEKKKSTSFADLVWKPVVLIEMKKRGEDLSIHHQQALDYWINLAPDRPQYMVLCNFDEFWIYDLNKKVYEPLDKIPLEHLPKHREAFNFLLQKPLTPIFNTGWEAVSKDAAFWVAHTYRSMIKRKVPVGDALHYILQSVVAMFSQDIGLLPGHIYKGLINECEADIKKNYDLIGQLFFQMNTPGKAPAGRYKDVEYFNGGLFKKVIPVDLTEQEINNLSVAASKDWSKVNPAIFGSLFESGMDKDARHELGAHYTSEADIKMIVYPVIVKPWMKRIENATTLNEYYGLLNELRNFKVLDPACGSGNFLYVAFMEMKQLEKNLLAKIRAKEKDGEKLRKFLMGNHYVSTKQFFGLDINPYAVELAKVTLMVAKEISVTEKDFDNEAALPLDNLDANIICADALFTEWPETDAIIGNPPFQSKNKMQDEFGAEYINKLHKAYPEIPGRADFCVYWFYKSFKTMKPESYAGLVGTNTIRQNYSREGSLDYIVQNGGTIIEAVSSERWSGEAAVHVSIASWKKGKAGGPKILYMAGENNKLIPHAIEADINSSLSLQTDVSSARVLNCNKYPKTCFQGQTHGHEGFLMPAKEAVALLKKHPEYSEVLKPFLVGEELVGNFQSQPKRFVIDFDRKDLIESSSYQELYKIVEKKVLPTRKKRAEEQENTNKELIKNNPQARTNKHHVNFYNRWWQLSYSREDMIASISKLSRYVICSRRTQRPIFEFIQSDIRINDAIVGFAVEDDYSCGIIQSKLHWRWFLEKGATLGETPAYTPNSVWDTFPWPQQPTQKHVEKVAKAAKAFRDARNKAMQQYKLSLRDLYRLMEKPGKSPIRDLSDALDEAVIEAYGFTPEKDLLGQLLELNIQISENEDKGMAVQGPGLPSTIKNKSKYVSEDRIKFIEGDNNGLFKK